MTWLCAVVLFRRNAIRKHSFIDLHTYSLIVRLRCGDQKVSFTNSNLYMIKHEGAENTGGITDHRAHQPNPTARNRLQKWLHNRLLTSEYVCVLLGWRRKPQEVREQMKHGSMEQQQIRCGHIKGSLQSVSVHGTRSERRGQADPAALTFNLIHLMRVPSVPVSRSTSRRPVRSEGYSLQHSRRVGPDLQAAVFLFSLMAFLSLGETHKIR